MNVFRKYIKISVLAAMLILLAVCLAGCANGKAALDYGTYDRLGIEGFYLKAVNSVENDGRVYETNYFVCSDEELTSIVGTLTARFDEDGGLSGYDAVITQDDEQRVISFSKSREASSYTDTTYASDYSMIISTVWESISIKWDEKERFLSTGSITYYPNSVEKLYSEEQYITKNGRQYLSCTIERMRNEDGSLASEKITNYDENGEVMK